MYRNVAMAQKIELTEKGLNIINIDSNINEIKKLKLESIIKYIGNERIRPWFADNFNYYFINSDSMFIENAGIVKDVFAASGKSGEIKGIFIFLDNPNKERLLSMMNNIFDSALLASETSIESQHVRSKMFWKKNNISVFLDKNRDSDFIKISIIVNVDEDTMPGINVYY